MDTNITLHTGLYVPEHNNVSDWRIRNLFKNPKRYTPHEGRCWRI